MIDVASFRNCDKHIEKRVPGLRMAKETPAGQGIFLSLARASKNEYKLARVLTLASLPILVIVAFFARVKLPGVWGFIPSVQSVLVAGDLATMLILYAQFFVLRS